MSKPAAGTPLDTGGAFYGALQNVWNLNETAGTTFADDKGGVGLTLGGTATLDTSGGDPVVKVASGVGSLALASPVALVNGTSYSVLWEAAQLAAGNAGMVAGNGTNFLWMQAGPGVQFRGNDQVWALSAGDTTTMAVYVLTVAFSGGVNTIILYRNGTAVATKTGTAPLTISKLLDGDAGSFAFAGSLKRFWTFNRTLSGGEVTTISAAPDSIYSAGGGGGTPAMVVPRPLRQARNRSLVRR